MISTCLFLATGFKRTGTSLNFHSISLALQIKKWTKVILLWENSQVELEPRPDSKVPLLNSVKLQLGNIYNKLSFLI